MNIAWLGNLLEAALWWLISLVLVFPAAMRARKRREVLLLLSVGFFVFGITDLIEMKTGAWWRPPWLLVLKVACGASIGFGLIRLWQTRSVDGSAVEGEQTPR